jgi:cell division septum initiation protein DivIVA
MTEASDVQDLLAQLDQTEQQLAEFQDIVDAPSSNHDTDNVASSSVFQPSNAQPGAQQSSLRKIDDLLGSLNQKQQEWEQKVIANQNAASKNAPGAFLPRSPVPGSCLFVIRDPKTHVHTCDQFRTL